MAIECTQCPQTFRTQNGKAWHVQHIHAELPAQDSTGQGEGDDFIAPISDTADPLAVALDEQMSEVLDAEDDIEQEDETDPMARWLPSKSTPTAIHREPSRSVQVAEMSQSPSSFMSCSLKCQQWQSVDVRDHPRWMKIPTGEMIDDALEYVARAKAEGRKPVNYSDQSLTPVTPILRAATLNRQSRRSADPRYDHRMIRDFVASLEAS